MNQKLFGTMCLLMYVWCGCVSLKFVMSVTKKLKKRITGHKLIDYRLWHFHELLYYNIIKMRDLIWQYTKRHVVNYNRDCFLSPQNWNRQKKEISRAGNLSKPGQAITELLVLISNPPQSQQGFMLHSRSIWLIAT